MKNKKKIYLMIGIIVILYLMYLLWARGLLGSNRTMTGEIHLIPIDYIGRINILFDQQDGLKKEYLDGKRLYKIPKSGILKTQFNSNPGWARSSTNLEFYYAVSSANIKNRLKWNYNGDTSFVRHNINEIGIIGFGYGSGASWINGPHNIDMLGYSVDTLNEILIRRKGYNGFKPISNKELDNWNK